MVFTIQHNRRDKRTIYKEYLNIHIQLRTSKVYNKTDSKNSSSIAKFLSELKTDTGHWKSLLHFFYEEWDELQINLFSNSFQNFSKPASNLFFTPSISTLFGMQKLSKKKIQTNTKENTLRNEPEILSFPTIPLSLILFNLQRTEPITGVLIQKYATSQEPKEDELDFNEKNIRVGLLLQKIANLQKVLGFNASDILNFVYDVVDSYELDYKFTMNLIFQRNQAFIKSDIDRNCGLVGMVFFNRYFTDLSKGIFGFANDQNFETEIDLKKDFEKRSTILGGSGSKQISSDPKYVSHHSKSLDTIEESNFQTHTKINRRFSKTTEMVYSMKYRFMKPYEGRIMERGSFGKKRRYLMFLRMLMPKVSQFLYIREINQIARMSQSSRLLVSWIIFR